MITVTFSSQATDGCWQITDLAPSGLAPIERGAWPDGDLGRRRAPWSIEGQRVVLVRDPGRPIHEYVYVARVVSPGHLPLGAGADPVASTRRRSGDATGQFVFTIR